jgi:predicted TIM-barrel fold metal-dependent hydrolase
MSNRSRRAFLGTAAGAAALTGCARSVAPVEAQKKEPAAAAKITLEEFQPKSMLVVPEHPVTRAKFPVIDVHTHIASVFGRKRQVDPAVAFKQLDEIVKWNDEINLKTIINVTGGWGDELKKNVNDLQERYKGHFVNCVTPAWDKAAEPGYAKWQADELANARKMGAVGLKILKTLGVYLREKGKEGPLVKIDDPRFDPMWEAAGALNLPVFIHTGDPDAFFTPIDRFNERWEELGNHPDWSFYGKDFPPKAELLAARNRVIEKHPKTKFIGLHVANRPENLDEVTAWMKKYPNLYVEIGARLGELGRQPRRARKFFDDFPDRIMFGTDGTPNGKEVPQQDLVPAMYQAYFRFLETLDEYFDYAPSATPPQGRWRIYGIGLPDAVLKKVYHNNAARLLGWKLV